MEHKFENSDCGYGELLVSYLYDEATAPERASVEAHLAACAACADEYEAVSGIRFAVAEWKTREFDPLPTPPIAIPAMPAVVTDEVAGEAAHGTWLAALRNFFALSPALSLAAASLAFVALAAGVAFIATGRGDADGRLASGTNRKPTPTPSAERVASSPTPPPAVPGKIAPAPIAPTQAAESSPTRVDSRTRNAARPQAVRASAAENNKKNVRQTRQVREQVNPLSDEEEDDSLRLAELFDEIGMK